MTEKKVKHVYGFDSQPLEKAAQAAKYLDASPNAKEAFQLTQKKEETKQLEHQENIRKLDIERVRVAEDEHRKSKEHEVMMARRKAEYQVQLELQRDDEKLKKQQAVMEENRRHEEESVLRQEAMKRQTIDFEYEKKAELKKRGIDYHMEKRLEAQARTQVFQEKLIKLQGEQRRENIKSTLTTLFQFLGSGAQSFFSSPKLMTKTATFIAGSAAAILFARAGINIMSTAILARFGRPVLVRETSKISTDRLLKLPLLLAQKAMTKMSRKSEKQLLQGVILNPELEAQIKAISYAVLNRRKHYAPYRNFLFYGPPGTGKTLFAKKLAMNSGMDYAVMSGADISPLGPAAIHELHSLFGWTEKNKNGIILFIDEADAFLRKRRGEQSLSENLRNAINAFLYRTGTQSDKFMLILASNTPEQLDEAILDRIDELVYFERPGRQERIDMIYHYLLLYCNPPKSTYEKLAFMWKHPKSLITGKKLIGMEGVDHSVIEKIADKADGFSGREVAKMVVAWHDAAFALENPILTPAIMEKILDKLKVMHDTKQGWGEKESELLLKLQAPELTGRMHGEATEKMGADAPKGIIIDAPSPKATSKKNI